MSLKQISLYKTKYILGLIDTNISNQITEENFLEVIKQNINKIKVQNVRHILEDILYMSTITNEDALLTYKMSQVSFCLEILYTLYLINPDNEQLHTINCNQENFVNDNMGKYIEYLSINSPYTLKLAKMLFMSILDYPNYNANYLLYGIYTADVITESIDYFVFKIYLVKYLKQVGKWQNTDQLKINIINFSIEQGFQYFNLINIIIFKTQNSSVYYDTDYKIIVELYKRITKQEIIVQPGKIPTININFSEFRILFSEEILERTTINIVVNKITYSFDLGLLYPKYRLNDNNVYNFFLYKGMTDKIDYTGFSKHNIPSWYSIFQIAYDYVQKPIMKYRDQQHEIYAFSLYKKLPLFLITLNNLKLLKALFGQNIITEGLTDRVINILNNFSQTMRNRIIETVTYNDIIDFCFFYSQNENVIVRKSVADIDMIFIKKLCKWLNTEITTYDFTSKYRVQGYFSDIQPNYDGKLFHPELAICNSYMFLERRIDNPNDFAYSKYQENNTKAWCSIKDDKIVCQSVATYNKYHKTYLNYWDIVLNWANDSYKQSVITHYKISENDFEQFNLQQQITRNITKWKDYSFSIKAYNTLKAYLGANNITQGIEFTKNFLHRLFYHISQIPYNLNPKHSACNGTVWRPNHGSVHHMRTIAMSCLLYYYFENKNPITFYKYFKNFRTLIAAIIASVFVSLLRIDEDDDFQKRGGSGKFKPIIPPSLLSKIFPVLSKNKKVYDTFFANNMTVSYTQLSSCFFLMSILGSLLLPSDEDKEFIEILGLSNIYYSTTPLQKLKFSNNINTNDQENIINKINILHGLTMAPHYLDHCRGSFSDGIYKVFVYNTLDQIGCNIYDIRDIIYNAIKNILITGEYSSWNNISASKISPRSVYPCLYTEEELKSLYKTQDSLSKFKDCCRKFSGKRYTDLFCRLSKSFEELWTLMDIENKIISIFENKIQSYYYTDNSIYFNGIENYSSIITRIIPRYKSTFIKTEDKQVSLFAKIKRGLTDKVKYNKNHGLSNIEIDNIITLFKNQKISSLSLNFNYVLTKDIFNFGPIPSDLNEKQLKKIGITYDQYTTSYKQLVKLQNHDLTKYINEVIVKYYFGDKRITKLKQLFKLDIPILVFVSEEHRYINLVLGNLGFYSKNKRYISLFPKFPIQDVHDFSISQGIYKVK